MPAQDFVLRQPAIQYDGTNSAEVLTALGYYEEGPSDFRYPTIVSETGGILTLRLVAHGDTLEQPIPTGAWLMTQLFPGGLAYLYWMPEYYFNFYYTPVSTLANP